MPKSSAQLDREIAEVLTRPSGKRVSHTTKRWNHADAARSQDVSEDVVRRIYAAIQTAKKQGLYGVHTVDLIERSLGRRLMGGEYTVSAQAHEHLAHKPPSGYGGPKPRGSAREPARASDPRIAEAGRMTDRANRIIYDVRRRKDPWSDWSTKDRELLRQAADELDVAATSTKRQVLASEPGRYTSVPNTRGAATTRSLQRMRVCDHTAG